MNTANKIAFTFSQLLREELGTDLFNKMVAEHIEDNAVNQPYCISHDYCDANVVMQAAFEKVLERPFRFWNDEETGTHDDMTFGTEAEHTEDLNLFNEAWTIAKVNNFYTIQSSDIVEGAQFKTSTGIIWNIDSVKDGLVETSMEGGKKGNYRNTVEDCAAFLTEEHSTKL